VAFGPGEAEAVPTVKEDWPCAATEKRSARKMEQRIGRRKGINHLREEMEDSAEGWLRQSKEKGTIDFNTKDTEFTETTEKRESAI
jgi:hypothetical protein